MFDALADQLQAVRGTEISPHDLRVKIVQYLKDNPTLVSDDVSIVWRVIFLFLCRQVGVKQLK